MKHLFTSFNRFVTRPLLLASLLLAMSSNAWGEWKSGSGVKKNGTWYVLYEDAETTIGGLSTKTYNLSGPGASLSFSTKKQSWGTGNVKVTDNDDNSIGNYSTSTSYASKTGTVKSSASSLNFYNAGTLKKYVKLVHVTMAQYVNAPSATSLDCGTADINNAATGNSVTVAWCNVPAMTYTITGTDKDLFSVSITNNSEAGKYNTATFTVNCMHTRAGKHSATLTIKDTYNSYSKTVALSGETRKLLPDVVWSSDDEIFNDEDVLSASNPNDLTVTLSSAGNDAYVRCEGNTATMLAATTGKITITAHITGNDVYADHDVTKQITITNLIKQHITWTQELARLKTTDATKTITLDAVASSGLPVSYQLYGDKTGLTLKQSGSNWTLTYTGECKNTTIVATQAGNATYAPASAVSLPVKVIDPTKVCDTNETLVNSTVTLKNQSTYYNIDVPSAMTIAVSRTKTGWLDIYTNGFNVEFYSGKGATGTKLAEHTYSASDINKSKTIELNNLDIAIQSVKLISNASNGYNVTSVTYTKQKYCNLSVSSLAFTTCPNATATAKTVNVSYANNPISVVCSNPKFTFTPGDFGDCSEYGTQTVSVNYTAGEQEGTDVGYLYIKDNTGTTLKTCTLNVTVTKIPQTVSSTNIAASYKTTDKVLLSAVATSGLTDFVFSASPAGVAVFDGANMTFAGAGTIALTATQPGNSTYKSAAVTVENVTVSKVTPDISLTPAVSGVTCYQVLTNDLLSGGEAAVTLHGVANTAVEGSFVWQNAGEAVDKKAGIYDYTVEFIPANQAMYNSTAFTVPVTVNRAEASVALNNGTVVVSTQDEVLTLDMTDKLMTSKVGDGELAYEVVSGNAAHATISGSLFSADEAGEYTVRCSMAETDYYTAAATDFTITVTEGVIFAGVDGDWSNEDNWSADALPTAADRVIINADVTVRSEVEAAALTIELGNTVTIADGGTLTIGSGSSLSRAAYGNIVVEAGGQLRLGTGEVQVNDFTLYSTFDNHLPKSGQVARQEQLTAHGKAYFILDLDPNGEASYGWYDFTVPFPVDELHGVTRKNADGNWQTIANEKNYAVMEFREELRAQGQYAWKKYTGTLQPGKAYSMTIDSRSNTYRFEMLQNGTFLPAASQHVLQASEGEGTTALDRGWNGIGNGTMQYVTIEEEPVVQMYDHVNNVYRPVSCENEAFAVGAAYFYQTATHGSALNLSAAVNPGSILRAPQRASATAADRLALSLTAGDAECDRLFVTCDDEDATEYTVGKDVQKMGETTATRIARLWTDAKGTQLCAVHAAYADNQAVVPLQLFTPKAAEYTLSLENVADEDVYLTRDGVIVCDLNTGAYTFDLNAGTDSSYALLVIRRINNVATGAEASEVSEHGTNFVEKMIVNGQLFLLRDGVLYDVQGRTVSAK